MTLLSFHISRRPSFGPGAVSVRSPIGSATQRPTSKTGTSSSDTTQAAFRPFLPDGAGTIIEETPVPAAVGRYAHRLLTGLWPTEPTTIPNETPMWNLAARTTPTELTFEPEVAEVCEAGYDPTAIFSLCSDRIQMVHLRDVDPTGPFRGYEDVPHGEGLVDMDAVVDAATDAGVDWVIYENELDSDPEAKITHGAATLERLLDKRDPS